MIMVAKYISVNGKMKLSTDADGAVLCMGCNSGCDACN